ncbi:MAG: thiamine-binding protein [Planctomycetota bacterium]|nr:MAG: thiamine-binding protein [Planctomycetota bacterium]REJ91220.1 MAG: thiamine-binding protein [Planctomycetota bacterium]REK22221.1 MAG: thiamine-binding protein [Planctomycetota bacterium]REK44299.1 MAG: thiamine-binding protein [Planctomycetota bacterium]
MYLLEFSMSPLNRGESVSEYVARSLQIIDESGLPYELHAMGTIVEGELGELLALLEKCFDAMREDCDRISCVAKFDYRRDAAGRLKSKVASVERRLGRPLQKGKADNP